MSEESVEDLAKVLADLPAVQTKLRAQGCYDYPTPWMRETVARMDRDGALADYGAWKEWMDDLMQQECEMGSDRDDCCCPPCRVARWWDEIEELDRPVLYSAMSDCCRFAAEACGWRAQDEPGGGAA